MLAIFGHREWDFHGNALRVTPRLPFYAGSQAHSNHVVFVYFLDGSPVDQFLFISI
jgi:hypothetical protein